MEFWFDDGYEDDYSKSLPFLLKHKCTGIAAISTNLICEPGYMCLRKVRGLIGAGWKIASHGTDHKPMVNMTRAETDYVLSRSKAWIKAHLGVTPEWFAAPWNILRPDQVKLALKHYKFVRSPRTLHFHSNNFTDVERTITQILHGGNGALQEIEKKRYEKSRRMIKQMFGFDV